MWSFVASHVPSAGLNTAWSVLISLIPVTTGVTTFTVTVAVLLALLPAAFVATHRY